MNSSASAPRPPDRVLVSGITLTESLREGAEERALAALTTYFAPLTDKLGFTGGVWDTFDPSGTRAACADSFTADDVVSVTLLSVRVPGRAAVELLDRQRTRYEELLRKVDRDRDLVDVDSVTREDFPAWSLWSALRELPGLGATTVSKLMARKRPRLIPIFDSVINRCLLGGSGVQWAPLHAALRADNGALHHRMLELREAAGLSEQVVALRVLDVVAWMDGTGQTSRALQGVPVHEVAEDAYDEAIAEAHS